MKYAIEADSLVKSFKGFKAVDDLSLRVHEGSIYGFLGPNGAGKTTTIKMLTGLSKPDSGSIRICGNTAEFGSLKNHGDIGFLPDVPNFYDWMTPVEFLKLAGQLLNMNGKALDERIDYLLQLVGLQGVHKKIGGFSRGMKQRLGIAQALVGKPRVVFLDEPTSALDPLGRKEILDIITKLSGEATVFFSTHILSDVEKICDRVIILNKGKAVIEDTIDNLKCKYSKRAIAIEIEQADKKPLLIEKIKNCKWFEKVSDGENGELIISVSNTELAGMELPGILDGISAGLRKLVHVEPTLEDIFMRAVDIQ